VDLGYSTLTRRERLERIAMAERDRRAGRVEVAVAALGEASEWPARVVLALAKLPEFEAPETRQILEEGLDLWMTEVGLAPIEERVGTPQFEFGRPIDNSELERAFAEAEAQTDEMHSANHVAARVLMDEPMGLAELGGDMLAPVEESDLTAMDAARVEDRVSVDSRPSRSQVLAILERWLQNLEVSNARRAP